ncbi:MAG TPA: sugar ABC transporter ATP-binding protein, partial [Spirochaetota bacterium]|nr:sugar ABC transporter ATP-binding protein [Spirochaetota bacterium]
LNEVEYIADKITVIRDGAVIKNLDKKNDSFTEDDIITAMVGRTLTDRFPKRNSAIGEVCLEVKNWNVYHPLYEDKKVCDNVNLTLRKGEIVGISGLMGAGRTELAMSIFGKSYGQKISGELILNGKKIQLNSIKEAIKEKIAYVTEDRKDEGLLLNNPIYINTTLAKMDKVSKYNILDLDLEVKVSNEYKQKLNTKCSNVMQNVGSLSGGNQQKVLLSKWMFADPDVLMLDEPTRGIDVGAKYEIYTIMNQLVAEGKSVLMISSEMPEILGMCDRVYVMYDGRIVAEFTKEQATQESIMSAILSSAKGV